MGSVSLAHDERFDPERIAESKQSALGERADDRVGAADDVEHTFRGAEEPLGERLLALGLLDLLGEDVKDRLEITIRRETHLLAREILALEIEKVGDVPVVGHRDARREDHMERLDVLGDTRADGGIAHVADPELPLQAADVFSVEDVAHEPLAALHMERLGHRDDPRRVLAAVLDREQCVVNICEDVSSVGRVDPDEATHVGV